VKLWLDDIRQPPDDSWYWAKDAHDAWYQLQTGEVTIISLDHDLGNDPYTGYWVLLNLEQMVFERKFNYDLPMFSIHSANPVGRRKMAFSIQAIKEFARS
jgi:hypothetical protein